MDRGKQRYPMEMVDSFQKDHEGKWYQGVKNFSCDSFYQGTKPMISLCLEGMGQTAEYNIRNVLFDENQNVTLYLASIKSADFEEFIFDQTGSYLYRVSRISKFGNMFISELTVFYQNITDSECKYCGNATIVHSL